MTFLAKLLEVIRQMLPIVLRTVSAFVYLHQILIGQVVESSDEGILLKFVHPQQNVLTDLLETSPKLLEFSIF